MRLVWSASGPASASARVDPDRLIMPTSRPSSKKALATASPIPDDPAVTTTRLAVTVNKFIIVVLRWLGEGKGSEQRVERIPGIAGLVPHDAGTVVFVGGGLLAQRTLEPWRECIKLGMS